jgi:hypothetical protein
MAEQVPAPGQVFLDHVGWFVEDIEVAARTFDRLGFPLTPYSVHGDKDPVTGETKLVGSANRLAMLEVGYLEILTPVAGADTPVARHMRGELARHPGVHLVAFTVADADAEPARLAAAGFALSPTVNLRRTIEAEDGGEVEVAFTVVRPVLGSIPEGRMQVLTHHTPEHMWQRRYVAREADIAALTGVVFACADPAESAERLGRLTGRAPVAESDGSHVVTLDRGRLVFVKPTAGARLVGEPERPAPLIAAVELASTDLARTERVLAARGVSLRRSVDGRLVVPAEDAAGTALLIG